MSRIRVETAPDLDHYYSWIWPARVEIRSGDRRFEREVLHPTGEVARGFGWDEAIAKFHSVVQPALGAREAEELVTQLRNLDEATEMPPLSISSNRK